MRCYRKILRISYIDHVTNEEDRAKIQQAIGPYEGLLQKTFNFVLDLSRIDLISTDKTNDM